jgi:hypothetical protein
MKRTKRTAKYDPTGLVGLLDVISSPPKELLKKSAKYSASHRKAVIRYKWNAHNIEKMVEEDRA